MAWTTTDVRRLAAAADRFDRPAVEASCIDLVAALQADPTAIADEDAQEVLAVLRRKRYFRSLQRVADALVLGGHDTPRNRRQYAQALIDQGVLAAALSVLGELLAHTDEPDEVGEAAGLVGRVHKQLYVQAGAGAPAHRARSQHLARSVAAYLDCYAAAPRRHLWQGVNAVALLHRAAADQVALPRFPRPAETARALAGEVLAAVEATAEPDVWQRATALEACLALGRYADARSWLERYVSAPGADAFELASTLRQLEQVWLLDSGSAPGADLLPLLQAELLRREGGRLTLSAPELQATALAALHDRPLEADPRQGGFVSLRWMEEGLRRCRSVARIEDVFGEGLGTGFLVDGRAFRADWPPVVLMTNAHVVPGSVYAEDAVVNFRGTGASGDDRHRVDGRLWTSPVGELDATILALRDVPVSVTPSVAAPDLGPPGSAPAPRAFVIGHPEGSAQPLFSLENNAILDVDGTRVHYTAATRHGSSGSPVYDEHWGLIALHHAGGDAVRRLHGSGTYRANEGIAVQRIRRAVAGAS